MIRTTIVMWALVAMAAAAPAEAAEVPPAPAVKPEAPAGDALLATVKVVEGNVESRAAVGQPWAAVRVGQALAEGTDLRTGFRARCVLDMTDSLAQVGPLSVLRILEVHKQGETVRTRLLLKQGNVQADVEKGRIRSDFAIVTPSDTLAVRGTRGIQVGFFQAFGGHFALVRSGLAGVTGDLGQSTPLSPGQETDGAGKPAGGFLQDQRMGRAADANGYEHGEQVANRRRGTLLPIPPLSPFGPGPLQTLGLLQQHQAGLIYTGPAPLPTIEDGGGYEYEGPG